MEGIENFAFEDDEVGGHFSHYSTLEHPKKLSESCKPCSSAPSTLLRKKNEGQNDKYIAPLHINVTNHYIMNSNPRSNNNNNTVLPSPKLRAHELAILAAPFKSMGYNKKKSDSRINLHMPNGQSEQQRLMLNKRLLILSVTFGVLLVILTIVIIVVWLRVLGSDKENQPLPNNNGTYNAVTE